MDSRTQWTDTICALATPPGVAGLAVVRVSGWNATAICEQLFRSAKPMSSFADHTIHYGCWVVAENTTDTVTLTLFKAPHSYTGEDVVEIGCHGGYFVTQQILSSLLNNGARLAEPGEFTRRAFLNGKLDLLQVEAVADLIHAQSEKGAQTAARQLVGGFTNRLEALRLTLLDACSLLEVELDFSEEGYEFVSRSKFALALADATTLLNSLVASASASEMLRSGFACAVVGYPNAGKSSLFNALLDRSRAIVSDVPGTTRDYLEDAYVDNGFAINLYDTAGLRESQDVIELQGMKLTSSVIEQSNLILLVNDASVGYSNSDALRSDITLRFPNAPVVVVQNKMDMVQAPLPEDRLSDVATSAIKQNGVRELRDRIRGFVTVSAEGLSDALINNRQAALLRQALQHLTAATASLKQDVPAELISIDVRATIRILGEITGETWTPDVLDAVFSRFCIGK